MKKLSILILTLSLFLVLSSCSSPSGDVNDKTPTNQPVETQSNQNDSTETQPVEKSEADNSNITLSEQVIYEGNDVKITVAGFNNDDFYGPSIKVLIENNSTKNITFQTANSSLNGVMIETMFSSDVAAGKKANDSIIFYSSDCEIAGITTIKDIEFSLVIFDTETWDDIVSSDLISLTTSAEASFEQKYDDTGFVILDSDEVKVVAKKLNSSDSFWGSDLYLYMENNTSNSIVIQASDVSINGFMVDPLFSCSITAGKKAFDTMVFMESDLTNNAITDITDLELKLVVLESDSYETIKETDIITLSFD